MKIAFQPHDKAPLDWGLDKIGKMSANIVKMGTFVRVETNAAARHSAACEKAKTFLATAAERPEGFSGELPVDDDVREVLYTSALAWLRDLNDNLIPHQTKLSIGANEADKRRGEVENLRDRLAGILGIFDGVADDAGSKAADAPKGPRAVK